MDKSFTKILDKTVLAIGRYGRVDFLSFFLDPWWRWETIFFKQETEKGVKFVAEEHAF